jgi:hypothetical protein
MAGFSEQFENFKSEAIRLNPSTQNVLDRVVAVRFSDNVEMVLGYSKNPPVVSLTKEASNAIALAFYRSFNAEDVPVNCIVALDGLEVQHDIVERYELDNKRVARDSYIEEEVVQTITVSRDAGEFYLDDFLASDLKDVGPKAVADRKLIVGQAGSGQDRFGGINIVTGFTTSLPFIDQLCDIAERNDSQDVRELCDWICASRERPALQRRVEVRITS